MFYLIIIYVHGHIYFYLTYFYFNSNRIDDEWIPENDTKSYTKDVLVHQLKAAEQIALENYFKFSFKESSSQPQPPASNTIKQHRKNQRKQSKAKPS